MNTSYFSNYKNIEKPVSISAKPPKWYKGATYGQLAPSIQLVREYNLGHVSIYQYEDIFNEQLYRLNPEAVYSQLVQRYGENATLICYEKPGDFCHRRLVALWLENKLGVKVPELPPTSYYKQLREDAKKLEKQNEKLNAS